MLVYPNKMDFPVMENFGVSPPPLGMLEVTIERAEGLPNSDFLSKSDPYCEVRYANVLCRGPSTFGPVILTMAASALLLGKQLACMRIVAWDCAVKPELDGRAAVGAGGPRAADADHRQRPEPKVGPEVQPPRR